MYTYNAVPYGACDTNASYCFGRLPGALDEADAELLACDSSGNIIQVSGTTRMML